MSEDLGITAKKSDLSEWYKQVVVRGKFADYSPVKGMVVYRPNGYGIWDQIMHNFDKVLQARGAKNTSFPLLLPESLLKKESEHFAGFTPEVLWVTQGGASDLEEKMALRPTSETIIHHMMGKWLQSYRDLPLRLNQWNKVYRYETKMTKPFIRGREIIWTETHTAFASKEEVADETDWAIHAYGDFIENFLALPLIRGRKTDSDKFAGAEYTLGVEALMPDGKALQSGTSHLLSQKFSVAFDVKFLDEKEKWQLAWLNSYGISMRLIGGLLMIHGDEKGAIIPPKVAPIQAVIVPIIFKGKEQAVNTVAKQLHKDLLEGELRVELDDREGYTPGWKFNDWEMQGVPLRIEIGPKDVEAKSVVIVRRDTGEKVKVKLTNVKEEINKELDSLQTRLFEKAKKDLESRTVDASSLDAVKKAVADKKWAIVPHCGDAKCEESITEATETGPRVIPFNKKMKSGSKCVGCGKEAEYLVLFGKAY
ncbi:MAG: proline--tRNA ligase [Candidatus Altiarchaeota archaeon]|nr:proline--tRNA ligase [Candidatus Altiarchaeota archaeon]